MPINLVTTRASGYVVGASEWNSALADNMNWMSGGSPSCKAYLTAPQAVGTGVASILGFTAETWDIGGMHSTAVNNSRFTAPVAGRYQLIATATFPAASYRCFIEPYVSGVQTGERSGTTMVDTDFGVNTTAEFSLTAGAYLEVVAWHNYASTLGVGAACVVKWVGR